MCPRAALWSRMGNWRMGKFAHYSTEQQHDIQCGDNHRNGIKHE
jgi:hypothetical protein